MTQDERQKIFGDIHQRHCHRLKRFCQLSSWNNQANDLLQEIWINIWNSLPRFREECAMDTWVTRIAVNSALMHRRSEGRRQRHLADVPEIDRHLSENSKGTEFTADTELRERLHACVTQLQARDRMIVSLHLEELSYREIATVVGIGENHVGVLLHRLKPILKKCITGEKNGK